jgi:hypothetical protein
MLTIKSVSCSSLLFRLETFGEKRTKEFHTISRVYFRSSLVKVGYKLDDQLAVKIVKFLVLIF